MIFPLSSFFTLFCNVIATSNLQDLRLIRDVASGFSIMAKESPAIFKVQEVCSGLVLLCLNAVSNSQLTGNPVISTASPQVFRQTKDKQYRSNGTSFSQSYGRASSGSGDMTLPPPVYCADEASVLLGTAETDYNDLYGSITEFPSLSSPVTQRLPGEDMLWPFGHERSASEWVISNDFMSVEDL